jgi:hypothetical protein
MAEQASNFFHGLSISDPHIRRQGMTTQKDRS